MRLRDIIKIQGKIRYFKKGPLFNRKRRRKIATKAKREARAERKFKLQKKKKRLSRHEQKRRRKQSWRGY